MSAPAAPGRLIAVVGPSGVGKDSVMDGVLAAHPHLHRTRRVITRAAKLGGEDYLAMTAQAFAATAQAGGFCLSWQAHGLQYGIPQTVLEEVRGGAQHMANLSRGVLHKADTHFPALLVLHITATPETLAARLAARGRESGAALLKRLSRTGATLPEGLDVIEISNDGPLADTIAAASAALQPERA